MHWQTVAQAKAKDRVEQRPQKLFRSHGNQMIARPANLAFQAFS
jgi:hypothetical protein